MQHELFGSDHDLDLRSNFIFEFSGSYYTSYLTRLEELNTMVVKSLM